MPASDDDAPGDDAPDEALDRNGDAPRDAWAEADRAYRDKWSDEPDRDAAPRPAGGAPAHATPRAVGDSYLDGMQAAGPHLGLGVQIAASMAVFAGGGYALDRWLGTSPLWLLVGAALGMVGIVALIVRVAREADRESARRRK